MLSKRDIEQIRSFRSTDHPVVSVYLNTDGKTGSKKEVETRLKEMTRLARVQIEADLRRDYRREALAEIQRVEDHIVKYYKEFNVRGLALFSCSAAGFWHEVELPRPPRNRFQVGDAAYVRPLHFQEIEYHRFCTALVDKNDARIYLIHKGTILEYKRIADAVPARIRRGGWSGYDEKRTARKRDHKINEHFHHVADTLFELYKRDQFEWLILGCKGEFLAEFKGTLHSYLREKLAAELDLPVDTPEHEVLERSARVEKGLVYKDHCHQVERLQHAVASGGMAVAGLEATLRYLNAQGLDTLVVARDFQTPGAVCSHCGYLGILDRVCPLCSVNMVEIPDVVTAVIDRSLEHNCGVLQVYEGVGLENSGQIGAFVRFRL
jgi:peptide subunit release factor 1 (eRF1)